MMVEFIEEHRGSRYYRPQVLHHVRQVDGAEEFMRGVVIEVLSDVVRKVPVSVGDELHELVRTGIEAALLRLTSGPGEGVSFARFF